MTTKFKSMIWIAVAFLSLTTINSCKKEDPKKDETKTEDKWTKNEKSTVLEYLKSKAKAPATSEFNTSTGGDISQDGIIINFTENIFASSNGNVYEGLVKLKLYTVVNVKDMIYRRASTISPKGDMLLSSGMFKVEAMDSANNPLKVQNGKTFGATINVPNNANDSIFIGRVSDSTGNQIVWDVWPNATAKRGQTNSLITGLNSFSWCNLDRYMNETPLTNIYVTLPTGFTSANSDVIIKYTGENSSAFLPSNSTLMKFTTDGSYYKIVQGRGAKLMALAQKNGKFYYAIVTISSITANHAEVITSMTETTEADYNNQIANF